MEGPSYKMLSEAYQSVYSAPNEDYEVVVGYLASEGLVESYDEADALIEQMSDEDILDILEVTGRGYIEPVTGKHTRSSSDINARQQKPGSPAMGLLGRNAYDKNRTKAQYVQSLPNTPKNQKRLRDLNKGGKVMLDRHIASRQSAHAAKHQEFLKWNPPLVQRESYDAYDVVLEHLLDEGYADCEENALVIMSNMSEDWMGEILEAKEEENESESQKKYIRSRRYVGANGGEKALKNFDLIPPGQAASWVSAQRLRTHRKNRRVKNY